MLEMISSKKALFFKNTRYASMFLDESTTTGMKIRPAYYGAIGFPSIFQWMMHFPGQTYTGGCEAGECYCKRIKDILSEYETL